MKLDGNVPECVAQSNIQGETEKPVRKSVMQGEGISPPHIHDHRFVKDSYPRAYVSS